MTPIQRNENDDRNVDRLARNVKRLESIFINDDDDVDVVDDNDVDIFVSSVFASIDGVTDIEISLQLLLFLLFVLLQ